MDPDTSQTIDIDAAAAIPGLGDVFANAPLRRLLVALRLLGEGLHVARRSLVFIGLAWLPLLVLSSLLAGQGQSLLLDFGVLARYVIAGPLLLAAEVGAIIVLGTIARRFYDLLPMAERPRFAVILASTRHRLGHPAVGVAVVVLAYALSFVVLRAATLEQLQPWARSADGRSLSIACWWQVLVSLPLLLMLLLGWLWRLLLWTRFLLRVSRLELVLVPVHPDKSAGVGFVGHSLSAFSPVAMALGVLVAGAIANQVWHHGAELGAYQDTVIALVVLNVVMFTGPLVVVVPPLLRAWRRGVIQYGELSSALGFQFERTWFGEGAQPLKQNLLERSDFSAAADLYAVAERAPDLRVLPVRWRSLVGLVFATLLPFVPVVLMVVSFDTLLKLLAELLH